MTTSNGGSQQGRIVDHVEGIVDRVNDRGVKLTGHADYVNFSRYASPPIAPPRRGASVRLGLDADGFVRELQVLDTSGPAPTDDRSREIRRQVAMKTAAQLVGAFSQCHEEAKIEHVFPLADKILAWLEKED
jgi:hypothetical protein